MLGSLAPKGGKPYSRCFKILHVGRVFTGAWIEVLSVVFWKPLVLSRFHGYPTLYQFCHVMFVNVMAINFKRISLYTFGFKACIFIE